MWWREYRPELVLVAEGAVGRSTFAKRFKPDNIWTLLHLQGVFLEPDADPIIRVALHGCTNILILSEKQQQNPFSLFPEVISGHESRPMFHAGFYSSG